MNIIHTRAGNLELCFPGPLFNSHQEDLDSPLSPSLFLRDRSLPTTSYYGELEQIMSWDDVEMVLQTGHQKERRDN